MTLVSSDRCEYECVYECEVADAECTGLRDVIEREGTVREVRGKMKRRG